MTQARDGPTPRHGASALDDLFASDTGRLGPDTILDLDDRHGSPLSTTEVDRLTAAMPVDGTTVEPQSIQGRMTRFADLMNQVDEAAPGDPLRAIAQLRQYVLRDETIPTLLWLRLFELYKAVDKKPVYEALAEHFARRYDRPMVGWNEMLADRTPQTPLSAMRKLDSEIEASWGTESGLARLQSLLCDRDQDDAIVFNAVLQRDLLDAAKIFLLGRSATRLLSEAAVVAAVSDASAAAATQATRCRAGALARPPSDGCRRAGTARCGPQSRRRRTASAPSCIVWPSR